MMHPMFVTVVKSGRRGQGVEPSPSLDVERIVRGGIVSLDIARGGIAPADLFKVNSLSCVCGLYSKS